MRIMVRNVSIYIWNVFGEAITYEKVITAILFYIPCSYFIVTMTCIAFTYMENLQRNLKPPSEM